MKGLINGRVSFKLPENQECLERGRAGFSIPDIAGKVDLTENQVRYRLGLHGIKVTDYRNGKGELGQKISERISRKYKLSYKRTSA